MIPAWWLCWICPICVCIGVLTVGLASMGRSDE
jgi:hypothetical protein